MLVGRKAERGTLDALVEGTVQGNGGVLLVSGEPGMGKTTLLDDVEERHGSRLTVLRTVGAESRVDLPFAALADLLRPATSTFRGLPPPQAKALRRALALEEGVVVDRMAVGVAMLGVLAGLSIDRPALVIVDDVHWLDEPSRATLLFVARRLSGRSIALVLAGRSGELQEAELRGLPTLELQGLRRRDAQTVLDAAARVPLDPAVRRRLLEVAEGNPLALAELPVPLSDTQLAGSEPLGEPVPVNGGIERAFGARIARLPEETCVALLLVAAAGGDAEAARDALRESGLGPEALAAAEADGLVVLSDGRVSFRHPVVQSVVYHGQSAARRRQAHQRLARFENDPDRRTWHAYAATEGVDESLAEELVAVGRRGLSRGAPASAARAFEAAAAVSRTPAVRGRRLADAARAAHRAGAVKVATRIAAAARKLTSDPVTLADLLLVESDLRMRAGDLEGAHRALVAQAEKLVPVDRRRAATMLLLAAKLRIYRLEAQIAVDEVERALALLPTEEHEVVHLVALSMSRTVAGRAGAREAAFAAAAAAARAPHGHAHTLGIAWPLIWLEEYDAARAAIAWPVALQREAGFLLYLPQALLALAELDFRTGDWGSAMAAGAEALSLFEETQQPSEAASAAGMLSRVEAARGNGDACRMLAQRAFASDVEFGLRSASAYALAALGLLELGERRPAEAVAPLEASERIAALGAVGEPWLILSAPDLVEGLARAGHTARALEVLRDFEERLERTGRTSASAAAARCEGILAGGNKWQEAFERALELHASVPTPFERARTELCYAERLRRARRRSEARALLRAALETFEELGARPWADRARAELRASGETARRRTTPVDSLTAQERVVAKLVVDGAKNREAAARLFVSEKTVEFHLANVYRKLGVRSRVELTRALGKS